MDPNNHAEGCTLSDWIITAGEHYKEYSLCGAKENAHAPCEVGVTAVSATCLAAGTTAGTKCSTCGVILSGVEVDPQKDHSYVGEYVDLGEAGHAQKCVNGCDGHGETVEHTWDDGKVTTKPTCTAEGVKTFTCTECGATKTENVEQAAHAWNGGVVTTEPTCTAEGVKTFTCTECGATKTENVEKAAHVWDGGAVTTEPTCTAEGVKTFTCNKCGATKTENVEKLAHSYTGEYVDLGEDGHARKCVNGCDGHGETVAHSGEWEVTTEPTYDAEGVQTFTCDTCGHTRTESIPALERPTDPDPDPTTYYTLTIRYVDAQGNQVAPTVTRRLEEGSRYTVDSPAVEGMTPDQETVTGILNSRTEITVTYAADENVDDNQTPTTEAPETSEPTESTEPTETQPPETEEPGETEDLDDNDTPLTETPDETEDLGDNDTPLADVPQTGDMLWLWILLAVASASGLIWISLEEKKGKRAVK